MQFCTTCKIDVSEARWAAHENSKKHTKILIYGNPRQKATTTTPLKPIVGLSTTNKSGSRRSPSGFTK